MKTKAFSELSKQDQTLLRETITRLPRSLNKVSNPRTSAIALTKNGQHYGNNIFLSNCTLCCAEASALAASVAAGDSNVTKLYVSVGRLDTETPKMISPCGNCRQMLHDFARLNDNVIEVFCTTNELKEVLVTTSDELLPEGFKSASLGKMAE